MNNRQTIRILNSSIKAGLQALEIVKPLKQDANRHNQCKGILALANMILSKAEREGLIIEGALIEAISNEVIGVVDFNNVCKQKSELLINKGQRP